ncbi:MAG: glycoside hydrolase [marine bacterium B5-7]|nr:MAG: glycoside hydrolase [marine bacterium B5-7]
MIDKPVRVLFISTQPFFEWRGSSIRVKFNMLALESLGIKVDLLTLPIGRDEPEIKSDIYRVPRIPWISGVPIGPSLPKLIFDIFILFKAFSLGFRNRYDVIHATEEGGMIAWLVGRLSGAKSIYEKHSDPSSYRKKGLRNLLMKAYQATEIFTARHVDSVICTGPGLVQQVRRYTPDATVWHIADVPSSRFEPSVDDVSSARELLQEDPEEVLVTYVGSFAVYQGIDLLFETIPKVIANHPKARFVVVGGSDEEIVQYRQQLGDVAARVRFTGEVAPDTLAAYLSASDILLAPRRAGINTPLKILDYFKAAGAIVATDNEANRLIVDETCALLCEFNPSAFAHAIGELIDSPSLRKTLADEGYRRYQTTFNFETFRRLLGEVYLQLVGNNRGINALSH